MKLLRILGLSLALAVLSACSGQTTRTNTVEDASDTLSAPELAVSEDYGDFLEPADQDPWENFNRKVYRVNHVLDRAVLRPVAVGYHKVTPRFMRTGISNFFKNLQQPLTALNLLLQGHPGQAGTAMGRFVLNIAVGAGGLLDPSSEMDIPLRSRDFGQTLAQWGWKDSRYLMLPVFGPSTLRDGIGKGASTPASPVAWLSKREGAGITVLYGVDARASVLPLEGMLQDASDPYLLIRDAYMQRRHCQIVDCSSEMPDYLLPDYDFEIPDFDSLR